MAVTSSSLMRWRSKKVDIVAEIPDYALLFYHNVSKWETDNASTHGATPTPDGKREIFYVYPLSILAKPDVIYDQLPDITPRYGSSTYVVRCVDSATDWPTKCDIRYSPSTTLTDNHETLFTTGGRHTISTLLGRPKTVGNGIPRLKTNDENSPTTGSAANKILKYNGDHVGHVHRSANFRRSILAAEPVDGGNPSTNITFMANLSLCAIFKNPKKSSPPITTFPKNTLVFYYGNETLESTFFEPNYSHPKPAKNVGNLSVPITLMPGEGVGCIHTGIQNYDVNFGTDMMIIDNTSNTSGFHDHFNILSSNGPEKYPSSKRGQSDILSNIGDIQNPVGHKHNIQYQISVSLKSKLLKAYLTKSNLAPIVDGIIIGYTLGKFSGYAGNPTDGANMLPQNWYFCDGTNGTPDLRGYYPFTNFEDEPSGELLSEDNEITISEITIETIPWVHTHVLQGNSSDGNPGSVDMGSHTTTYSPSATTHNHRVDTSPQYFDPPLTSPNPKRITNVRVGDIFGYTPPTVDIAFIMYKAP